MAHTFFRGVSKRKYNNTRKLWAMCSFKGDFLNTSVKHQAEVADVNREPRLPMEY